MYPTFRRVVRTGISYNAFAFTAGAFTQRAWWCWWQPKALG